MILLMRLTRNLDVRSLFLTLESFWCLSLGACAPLHPTAVPPPSDPSLSIPPASLAWVTSAGVGHPADSAWKCSSFAAQAPQATSALRTRPASKSRPSVRAPPQSTQSKCTCLAYTGRSLTAGLSSALPNCSELRTSYWLGRCRNSWARMSPLTLGSFRCTSRASSRRKLSPSWLSSGQCLPPRSPTNRVRCRAGEQGLPPFSPKLRHVCLPVYVVFLPALHLVSYTCC